MRQERAAWWRSALAGDFLVQGLNWWWQHLSWFPSLMVLGSWAADEAWTIYYCQTWSSRWPCGAKASHVWSAYLTVTLGWFVIWMFGINKWSSFCLIDLNVKSLVWGFVHFLTFRADVSVILWWTLNKHFCVFSFIKDLLYLLSIFIYCEILCSKQQNYYDFQTVGASIMSLKQESGEACSWLTAYGTCTWKRRPLSLWFFHIFCFPPAVCTWVYLTRAAFPLPGVPLQHGWLL